MKKILALLLTCLLTLGGTTVAFASTLSPEEAAPLADTASTEYHCLYLVPGTYRDGGKTVENTIGKGADKLSEEKCAEIFTENAYLCNFMPGMKLPKPNSERVDKNGEKYSFNGWWTIVDATVTYFDTVPEITETTFLYADWRADLSQRMDPVAPDPVEQVEPNHFLMIKHASGEEEKIPLRKSGTDVSTAMDLGYGYAVQLLNQITLTEGDVITVHTTGLDGSEEPVIAPIGAHTSREIQLESNESGSNRTADFLTADAGSQRRKPSMTVNAGVNGTFNIYIKFFNSGATMAVYMEPSV